MDRSLAYGELTSGAAEAGEVDRDRAKAGGGDAVEHGLPDRTPIRAMKEAYFFWNDLRARVHRAER